VITYSSHAKPAIFWPPASKLSEIFSEQFWRSLFYFNIYRLLAGCGLIIITWASQFTNFGLYNVTLFYLAAYGLVISSGLSMILIKLRHPDFNWQLTIQVISDIIFITIMIYASNGIQSGLGILLLVSLAGAGLISRGRLALFFASIATISVLLQEIYSALTVSYYAAQFTQAGLLSMGYFAVAWLAHRLAIHTIASERLANERGVDLANMAHVNQLVIQDLQEGVLVIDKDGYIRQRNTYAEKLLGLRAQSNQLGPLKLSDYVPMLANRLTAWQGDSDINFDLLRLAHNNGLVRTRFVPIEADYRNGVVIFLEDMSHVQAQVQQLKLAALGRLTANIAHEIRNPLSAISHAAELLGEDQSDTANPRLIRIICDNTQRLNKIVQDVLQLNRRNIAKIELINVYNFFHDFIEDFCHVEKIEQPIFAVQIAETAIINFDRGHLNQILWNLCRNAWRHCQKKTGSIQIKLSTNDSEFRVILDVLDDGPGVDPQQLKQLFEPFFTTAVSGTGLGLYIARELCESNHASLEYIENVTGSQFRIVCKSS